jgi:hypothetical protein
MTRTFFYAAGGLLLIAALALNALIPRYEYRQLRDTTYARIDRWTGEAIVGRWYRSGTGVQWVPAAGRAAEGPPSELPAGELVEDNGHLVARPR